MTILGAHLVPKEHRNIRDNLFVLYASINEEINGRSSSFDIQGYNVVKCFDEMWYEDTLNDIWDLDISNDKFKLLVKLYDNYKVVVKKCCKTNIQALSAL